MSFSTLRSEVPGQRLPPFPWPLAVLAASHCVNDFLAGWLLGGPAPESSVAGRLPWLVVYAALAFAGQLPVALLLERTGHARRWIAGALGVMALAVSLRLSSYELAVIASGIASAFCHVAGGALALRLPRGAQAIGWFSAPGVVGLALGGYLGHSIGALPLWTALLPLALLAGLALLRAGWPRDEAPEVNRAAPALDAHDGLMLIMLLALTLRSALWDLLQAAQLNDPCVLFALAASAGAGKVMGGWMVSRWPTFRCVSFTLLASCLILQIARGTLAGLCLGVALLQSSIPASIFLLHRSFGTSSARAAAYGLGVTVALGGLMMPAQLSLQAVLLFAAGGAALLMWSAEQNRGRRGRTGSIAGRA